MVRAYFTAFEFTHQMSQCSATLVNLKKSKSEIPLSAAIRRYLFKVCSMSRQRILKALSSRLSSLKRQVVKLSDLQSRIRTRLRLSSRLKTRSAFRLLPIFILTINLLSVPPKGELTKSVSTPAISAPRTELKPLPIFATKKACL